MSLPKPKLFFGSANAKKLKEIHEILGEQFAILSFQDLAEPLDVAETEPTLQGNAALKARAFYEVMGIPCISDDTGLEVEALGGAPGVYSARYAGENGNAVKNMEKLLAALEGKSDRNARFRTVIAYFDGKDMRFFDGVLEGSIGLEPIGNNGFGYDPAFYPQGESRTLAEMEATEKNAISHRGRALEKFVKFLQ